MDWILWLALVSDTEQNYLRAPTSAGGEVQLYLEACDQPRLRAQGYAFRARGIESNGHEVQGCWSANGEPARMQVWVLWLDRVAVTEVPVPALRAHVAGTGI